MCIYEPLGKSVTLEFSPLTHCYLETCRKKIEFLSYLIYQLSFHLFFPSDNHSLKIEFFKLILGLCTTQ